MDCNKEEAARCKALSEAHFRRNDLLRAKKYALKARQLFQDLEGLPQLFSILDVHSAACYKLRTGDLNFYGILQVSSKADDNTIRKQYRKLALLLHPDKNKAFGAEAAFKHISEAWSVLSDRDKKSGFDKRVREHMAAAVGRPIHGSFSKLDTFHGLHVATTHRSPSVYRGPTHVYSQHVYGPQRQFHIRVHAHQQLGRGRGRGQWHGYVPSQGQLSVPQPQGPWQASAPQPRWQGPESAPRQQGQVQGHAYAHSQQGQGQTHTSASQGQSSSAASHQQFGDQACVPDEGGQNQEHAHQQQGKNESSIQKTEGQLQAHVYKKQDLEQGQAQVHAHLQQGQEAREAHQAFITQMKQGLEHQVQGQAPVYQQVQYPVHAYQQVCGHQQGLGEAVVFQQPCQGQAHPPRQQVRDQVRTPEQQGQGHGLTHQDQVCVLQRQGQRQTHVNEQQAHCQVHIQCQQGQGPVHVFPLQRQGRTQAQGQAPVSSKENHVYEHPLQDKVQVHQQCQGPAHTLLQAHAPQQGQGPIYANQQQGQNQTHAQGQAHQARIHENNQAQMNEPVQPAFQQRNATFWTVCPSCRMQIEYKRAFENKNLCCPMCYKAFFAKEIAPVRGLVIWPPPVSKFKPVINTGGGIKSCSLDSGFGSIPRANSTLSEVVYPNKKAKIDTEDRLIKPHGHQKPQEALAQPAQKVADLQQKRLGRLDKDSLKKMVGGHTQEDLESLIATSKGVIAQKLAEEREKKAAVHKASEVGKKKKAKAKRSASASEPLVQNRKVANGKKDYVHKTEGKVIGTGACNARLSIQNSAESRSLQKGSGCCDQVKAPQRKGKLASHVDKTSKDQNEDVLNVLKEFESHGGEGAKHREVSDGCSLQKDDANGLTDNCRMEVPDPDFHNFDGDRTEDHFAAGQIWASYDDDDGMPRYYSCVKKILSRRPLKMQMNWLEACSVSEATLAWLEAGFQHSCGDFQLGSIYVAEEVSTFSHRVVVKKLSKGSFKIYPRQGDVWAVHRNWEVLKLKEDKQGYDMVEIISTFVEGKGIQVAPLFKVAGFKTIFEGKALEDHLKWISPEELRRFSHQVPAHRIMSGDVPGLLVDGVELDPASTPMDLIYGKQ